MPRPLAVLAAACIVAAAACSPVAPSSSHVSLAPTAGSSSPLDGSPSASTGLGASPPASPGSSPAASPGTSPATIYVHYYLWWTPSHWRQKLGASYPLAAKPAPLPGTVDATGCDPQATYPGATIVDLPAEGPYDQGQAATFDRHIAEAAAAGITGFLVSWQGTGAAQQDPAASGYDQRLDLLVRRVDAYNAGHAVKFRLGLAFAAFGQYTRPADEIVNDLRYFERRYGGDPAFANPFSRKPIVMWLDSRKLPLSTVTAVSAAVEPSVYLLGDETAASWARDAPYLDGTSYYWSSEDPATNRVAAEDVVSLGSEVHAAGKRWFAPFIAGYDKQLVGGSCVPRDGTQTLDLVWSINAASLPDAWFGISWNEFVENTYLEPSLRYGSTYLDEIRRLAHG